MRLIVFLGLYWGPLILGNYQIAVPQNGGQLHGGPYQDPTIRIHIVMVLGTFVRNS